jgi:hypothetical protein
MDLQEAFTAEQLAWRSRANATALILGTIALLKRHNMDSEAWFREYRALFRASWRTMEQQGAYALMTIFVLNPVSVGATLHARAGDQNQAEGCITGWPPTELLAELGLTNDDRAPFWNARAIGADYHDFEYTWWRSGAYLHMRLVRREEHAQPQASAASEAYGKPTHQA